MSNVITISDWTSAETQTAIGQLLTDSGQLKIHDWSHVGFNIITLPLPSLSGLDHQGQPKSNQQSVKVLLKEPPRDNRDNFTNELETGLAINQLRNIVPNFVWTYGLWSQRGRDRVALEYIPGLTATKWLSRNKHHFSRVLPVLIQLVAALTMAHDQLGFTHYNLHGGNIIIRELQHKQLITYPFSDGSTATVLTRYVPVFIDLGRSYTKSTRGHTIKAEGIRPRPNHFYDLYVMLNSLLFEHFPSQLKEILSWYGVEPSLRPRSDVFDIRPNKIKLITVEKFVKKAIKRLGYDDKARAGSVLTPS